MPLATLPLSLSQIDVRHNQTYDALALQAEAQKAVAEAKRGGVNQNEIAERIGKSPAAVSRALNDADPEPLSAVLQLILDVLTPYSVVREVEVRYRAVRK